MSISPRFPSLLDVSVRCVDPSASPGSIPAALVLSLLGCSSGALRTAQFQAPLSWLRQEHLSALCRSGLLDGLQMLVLANTCPAEAMPLGMDSVEELLEHCPELCALGSLRWYCGGGRVPRFSTFHVTFLRTWSCIDYFDERSPLYRRSEADFCRLKRGAVRKNWDIDFDVENIDFVFDPS